MDPAETIAAPATAATEVVAPAVTETPANPAEPTFEQVHEAEQAKRLEARGVAPKKADAEPAPAKDGDKPAEGKDGKPAEAKPGSAPDDKGKPHVKPADFAQKRIERLARENRELRAKLATPPPNTPAPATGDKPTEKPAASAVPEEIPDIYDFAEVKDYQKAVAKWTKAQIDQAKDDVLKAVEAKATTKETQAAAIDHATEQATLASSLDTELGDWRETVIGTEETPGIFERLDIRPGDLTEWADRKGDIAFRGFYALAKSSEAEQAEFVELPFDEQVAVITTLGKAQKRAATKPPEVVTPSRPTRVASPPPANVPNGAKPSVGVNDMDADAIFEADRNAKAAARMAFRT
jgi:hypothetical protein